MLSNRGCHTVKSILRQNPRTVVWLFRYLTWKFSDGGSGRRRWQKTRTADDV